METRLQTETRPQTGPSPPPPRAGNFIGRTWSRAWSYTRVNPMLIGFIVAGLIARIVFWAATDRKLDDAIITIKFDKNLADGFGLIHNFGEGHVQGFTSALSVLVPMPGRADLARRRLLPDPAGLAGLLRASRGLRISDRE
jgi:hypothetical protein